MKTLFLVLTTALLMGCDDASIASHNLSKAADMFEITTKED